MRIFVAAALLLAAPLAVACDAERGIADTLQAYDPLLLSADQRARVTQLTARAQAEVASDHRQDVCDDHAGVLASLSLELDALLTTEQRRALRGEQVRRWVTLKDNAREVGAVMGQLEAWMPKPKPEPKPEDLERRFDRVLEALHAFAADWHREQALRAQVAKAQVAQAAVVQPKRRAPAWSEPTGHWPDPRTGLRQRVLTEAALVTRALKRAGERGDHAALRARLAVAFELSRRLRDHNEFDVRRVGDALARRARHLAVEGGAMVMRVARFDHRTGELIAKDTGLRYTVSPRIVDGTDRINATRLYTLRRRSPVIVLFEEGHCGRPIVAVYSDPTVFRLPRK